MAKLREAALMEGKFFIEMAQLNDVDGTSGLMRKLKQANGGHLIKTKDDVDGDSDDEEETNRHEAEKSKLRSFSFETNEEDKDDDSHTQRDSGIDSLLHLETGMPGNDFEDDDDDDQAFRRVVHSKRRRGSRGGADDDRPESWSPSSTTSFTASTPMAAAKAAASKRTERNKSDADGSENEVAFYEMSAKQRKKKKRKNKKRTATASVEEQSADNWDQLDLVEDEYESGGPAPTDDDVKGGTSKGCKDEANDTKDRQLPRKEVVDEKLGVARSGGAGDGAEIAENDEVFESERASNGGSIRSSLSESFDNKTGIKSILKHRSRTFSGESTCSEAWENLPSSSEMKRGGSFNGRKHSTSLTSVTQSLESLSITSMLASDSCCEDGGGVDNPQFQYGDSWSSGGVRKSVHFSAVIDRKRFRSGAPPQNVGKGRRNSGGGKPNASQNHGKKRHLSEGDAVTSTTPSLDTASNNNARCGGVLFDVSEVDRAESPNGDQASVSSDDLFHMEELDEEEATKPNEISAGVGLQSLLAPSEGMMGTKEAENTHSKSGTPDDDADACRNGAKGSKKGKKNRGKKGKAKSSGLTFPAAGVVDLDEDDGWSVVGENKLGRKKGGPSRNSSDLSLSDVDDGHSIYITDHGASEYGAISITNG